MSSEFVEALTIRSVDGKRVDKMTPSRRNRCRRHPEGIDFIFISIKARGFLLPCHT